MLRLANVVLLEMCFLDISDIQVECVTQSTNQHAVIKENQRQRQRDRETYRQREGGREPISLLCSV